jgi:hypothetical protein
LDLSKRAAGPLRRALFFQPQRIRKGKLLGLALMRLIFLSIGVILTLLVAGCGGSDDSAPTKAEFAEQANEICEASTKKQRAAFKKIVESNPSGSNESALAAKFVNGVVLPADQRQVEELQTLEAPSGDEQQVKAMVAAMQQGVETAEKQSPQKFVRAESALKKGRSLAKAYGLKACS